MQSFAKPMVISQASALVSVRAKDQKQWRFGVSRRFSVPQMDKKYPVQHNLSIKKKRNLKPTRRYLYLSGSNRLPAIISSLQLTVCDCQLAPIESPEDLDMVDVA